MSTRVGGFTIYDYMVTAPATPGAGKGLVYFKTDEKLYTKNGAGVEVQLTDDDSGWITPTYQNGWVDYSAAGHAVLAYRKINRRVQVKGLTKNGTIGAVPIFTFPAGYRPLEIHIFAGIAGSVTSGAASTGTAHTHPIPQTATRIDVNPDGTVTTPAANYANSFLSLANVTFLAEQ